MIRFIAIALVTAWMYPAYANGNKTHKQPTPATVTVPTPQVSTRQQCMAELRVSCSKVKQFRVTTNMCVAWNSYRCRKKGK